MYISGKIYVNENGVKSFAKDEFFKKEINNRMDSILEKHLKRAFAQKRIAVSPEKNKNNTKKVNHDPILEKHLTKIFIDNEEISKTIKEAANLKKKNEEILKAFYYII